MMSVEGRQHPVDILYLDEPVVDYVRAAVDACLHIHSNLAEGDILAFLPSAEDIDKAVEMIEDSVPSGAAPLVVRPLYAALPWDDQVKALAPARVNKRGRPYRKCVVATNIAETSVTIAGVVYVVDAGFVKVCLRVFESVRLCVRA